MADKQALNATMFTFRKRDRGGVLTSATIAYIVLFILMFAAFASPSTLIPVAAIYLLIIVAAFIWIRAMFGVNARAAALALEEGRITPAASA